MKRLNKKIALGMMVFSLSSLSMATFAATTYNTPAQTPASKESVLSDFKTKNLERKKELLNAQVKAGTLTQAEADEILANMEARQADCDGTATGKNGGCGMGKGKNGGIGKGNGCSMCN